MTASLSLSVCVCVSLPRALGPTDPDRSRPRNLALRGGRQRQERRMFVLAANFRRRRHANHCSDADDLSSFALSTTTITVFSVESHAALLVPAFEWFWSVSAGAPRHQRTSVVLGKFKSHTRSLAAEASHAGSETCCSVRRVLPPATLSAILENAAHHQVSGRSVRPTEMQRLPSTRSDGRAHTTQAARSSCRSWAILPGVRIWPPCFWHMCHDTVVRVSCVCLWIRSTLGPTVDWHHPNPDSRQRSGALGSTPPWHDDSARDLMAAASSTPYSKHPVQWCNAQAVDPCPQHPPVIRLERELRQACVRLLTVLRQARSESLVAGVPSDSVICAWCNRGCA